MADLISLTRVNQLNAKIEELEESISSYSEKIQSGKVELQKLEEEVLKVHPEIAKKLEKFKAKPKDAYVRNGVLCAAAGEEQYGSAFSDLIDKYTTTLERVEYMYPRELVKLQEKVNSLKKDIVMIEGKLEKQFNIRENLPKEFHEALENVRRQIHASIINDVNNNIKYFKTCLQNPLYSMIKYAEARSDVFYFLNNLKKHYNFSFNLIDAKVDEDIIQQLKNANIADKKLSYYMKTPVEWLNGQTEHFIRKCNIGISREENRNIEKETMSWFKAVEANFIDEIAKYCADILSVSNVQIGADGSINGTINASNGVFVIKTIGAGGYNIQRFHYRVIIKKVA